MLRTMINSLSELSVMTKIIAGLVIATGANFVRPNVLAASCCAQCNGYQQCCDTGNATCTCSADDYSGCAFHCEDGTNIPKPCS